MLYIIFEYEVWKPDKIIDSITVFVIIFTYSYANVHFAQNLQSDDMKTNLYWLLFRRILYEKLDIGYLVWFGFIWYKFST